MVADEIYTDRVKFNRFDLPTWHTAVLQLNLSLYLPPISYRTQ